MCDARSVTKKNTWGKRLVFELPEIQVTRFDMWADLLSFKIYLLHVVPVRDDSMFNRIFQCQNSSLALRLIADVRVFLAHTNHHSLVARTTNNRRKDSSRCIVPGKASFAHTWAIVYNQRSNIIISHFKVFSFTSSLKSKDFFQSTLLIGLMNIRNREQMGVLRGRSD